MITWLCNIDGCLLRPLAFYLYKNPLRVLFLTSDFPLSLTVSLSLNSYPGHIHLVWVSVSPTFFEYSQKWIEVHTTYLGCFFSSQGTLLFPFFMLCGRSLTTSSINITVSLSAPTLSTLSINTFEHICQIAHHGTYIEVKDCHWTSSHHYCIRKTWFDLSLL